MNRLPLCQRRRAVVASALLLGAMFLGDWLPQGLGQSPGSPLFTPPASGSGSARLASSPPSARMAMNVTHVAWQRDETATKSREEDFDAFIEGNKSRPSGNVLLTTKSIQELDVNIRPGAGKLPQPHPADAALVSVHDRRCQPAQVVHWKAPADYVGSLYFEDPRVENHGMSKYPRLQPAFSVVRFYGTAALLPVKVLHTPPQQVEYLLGYGVPRYGSVRRELTPINGQ